MILLIQGEIGVGKTTLIRRLLGERLPEARGFWTRKEALLKREGIGLRMRLGRVETLERPDLVSWRREGFQFSFCGTPAVFCWRCIPLDGEQPR